MDHVLFDGRLKFIRGVSTGTLLVTLKQWKWNCRLIDTEERRFLSWKAFVQKLFVMRIFTAVIVTRATNSIT